MRSSLIINRSGPHSTPAARDALDAALASAAFGVQVGLLFIDDGVFQLLKTQNPEAAGLKGFTGIFESLPLYDVDRIFAAESALAARGLAPNDLVIPVQAVSKADIQALLNQYDNLLTF